MEVVSRILTMAIHIENKHWGASPDEASPLGWASHFVLSPLVKPLPTEKLRVAAEHMVEEEDAGQVDIEVEPVIDHLLITIVTEGEGPHEALRNATLAYLGGLGAVGVKPTDFEFVAAHLAYQPEMEATDRLMNLPPGESSLLNDERRRDDEARELFRDFAPVFEDMLEMTA